MVDIKLSQRSSAQNKGPATVEMHQDGSSSVVVADERTLLKELKKGRNDQLSPEVFPSMVRFISSSGRVVLFERPPRKQVVQYVGLPVSKGHLGQTQMFEIPLPWQLYAFLFDSSYGVIDAYIFGMEHELQTLSDRLYRLPLPNIHEDHCRFCLPLRDIKPAQTFAQAIGDAYEKIWSSVFNTDVVEEVHLAYKNKAPAVIMNKTFEITDAYAKKHNKPTSPLWKMFSPATLLQAWEQCSLEEIHSSLGLTERRWVYPSFGSNVGELLESLLEVEADVFSPIYVMNSIRTAMFNSRV